MATISFIKKINIKQAIFGIVICYLLITIIDCAEKAYKIRLYKDVPLEKVLILEQGNNIEKYNILKSAFKRDP